MLVSIFQCIPVEAYWDSSILDAQCVNLTQFVLIAGITNLGTDVMILPMPMPMVWRMQATVRQKLEMSAMFMIGFL